MSAPPTRDDDDRVLRLLRMRTRGLTLSVIAGRVGISRARVAQLTDGVRTADLAHGGEDLAAGSAAYWPTKAPRGSHAS